MIEAYSNRISADLVISKPLDRGVVFSSTLCDFDKDGFDLNGFENQFYRYNDIPVQYIINRHAYQHNWLHTEFNGYGLRIDHSILAARLEYVGDARKQLEDRAANDILFSRYLQIKPKFGLDLNFEFIFEDGYTLDLLHVEEDFHDYQEFLDRVVEIQGRINNYDFAAFARNVRYLQMASAEDHNEVTACLFGFERAYKTLKAI